MSELVDQFCEGISCWSQQTGASATEVCIFIMAATGGSQFLEPELYYNPSGLTVEDVKRWLVQLLSMTHMSDNFLVYSLIVTFDSILDDQFENASRGSRHVREAGERIREKTNDPHIIRDTYKIDALSELTPEKLRERRIKRDTWRTVYAHTLDYINQVGFV